MGAIKVGSIVTSGPDSLNLVVRGLIYGEFQEFGFDGNNHLPERVMIESLEAKDKTLRLSNRGVPMESRDWTVIGYIVPYHDDPNQDDPIRIRMTYNTVGRKMERGKVIEVSS
jgi:hypothetical protein